MTESDIKEYMSTDEIKKGVRYFVDAFDAAVKENAEQIHTLYKEHQTDKILELLKIKEFIDLDQINPELVAGVIRAFGNRSVGVEPVSLYSLMLDSVEKRQAPQNFGLAQYIDLASTIGTQTDIQTLSKKEIAFLRQLWSKYESYQARQGTKDDACAYYYMDALLDRGDLLNCQNLKLSEREKVIEKYLDPRQGNKYKNKQQFLKRVDEKNIMSSAVEDILRSPANYFEKEEGTYFPLTTDSRGIETKEYQKAKNAVMQTVQKMPQYDQNNYGHPKGLNERFDDLLRKTYYHPFRDIKPTDLNFLVRDMYLKTAEQDISDDHADRLSPYALALVLQNDKKGYWARKISPEIYETAKRKAIQERDEKTKSLFNTLKDAEFLIYRYAPKSARDLCQIVQSPIFLKLSPKEREDMIKLSEFAAKADVLSLSQSEKEEAAQAFRLILSGKENEKLPSQKKAFEVVKSVEKAYQNQKTHALRRTHNAEKIEVLLYLKRNNIELKEKTVDTLDCLISLQQNILSLMHQPVKSVELGLSKKALETTLLQNLNGEKIELNIPDYGSLPIFGRETEKKRRSDMALQISHFNAVLRSLSYNSRLCDELKQYHNFFNPKTRDQAFENLTTQRDDLNIFSEKSKSYNTGALWPQDIDENLELLISQNNMIFTPTELPQVKGLEHLYRFLENDTYNQERLNQARIEYASYQEAIKVVAYDRVGIDETLPPVIPAKGRGKQTADERLSAAYTHIDKLAARQGQKTRNNTIQVKNAVFKAKESIKSRSQSR